MYKLHFFVTEAPWNFRAKRPCLSIDSKALSPRDVKGLLPDQVTPTPASYPRWVVCCCFCFGSCFVLFLKHVNCNPTYYFSSQVYNFHKHLLLHLPDQYLWISNPLNSPKHKPSGEKAPWSCEIIPFFNGDQTATKWRIKIIRPLQDSDLCYPAEGGGG